MHNVETYLDEGYGFTISDLRLSMLEAANNTEFEIYNRDVKKMFIDHYGDRLQIVPNPKRCESELVYSSNISPSALAIKIRNLDLLRQAGESLNLSAKNVDFGLDDKVCDANELKKHGSIHEFQTIA